MATAFKIVQSNPSGPGRKYVQLKDAEVHKAFIVEKHQAGFRQQQIVDALQAERGVTLETHRLKRFLDKWGLSCEALTKKRKLHIQQCIRTRINDDKIRHSVRFKRSKRQLNQDEIAYIMGLSPKQFKNIKPSPGGIIIETPTPATQENEDLESSPTITKDNLMNIDEFETEDTALETEIGAGVLADEYPMEPMLEGSFQKEKRFVHRNQDTPNYRLASSSKEESDTIDVLEKVSWFSGPSSRRDEEQGIASVDQDSHSASQRDDEAPPLRDHASSDLNEPDDSSSESNESEIISWGTPFNRYALFCEEELQYELLFWKKKAQEFVEIVAKEAESNNISLEKAEELVTEQIQQVELNDPLPYQVCMVLLNGSTADFSPSELAFGPEISAWIENNFFSIRTRYMMLAPMARNSMEWILDSYLVHIPRIIREYGGRHFFTAYSLYQAGVLLAVLSYDFGPVVCALQTIAIEIFYEIGMGTHSIVIEMIRSGNDAFVDDVKPNPSVDKSRAKIQQACLQKYGKTHPRTLLVFSELALRTFVVNKKVRDGSLIACGVFYTIENSPQTSLEYDQMLLYTSLNFLAFVFQRCRKYKLATMALERALSLTHGKPTFFRLSGLGIVYSKQGEYAKSLKAHFTALHQAMLFNGLEHESIGAYIGCITDVMDKRGPIIYTTLGSSFESTFKILDGIKKTKSLFFRRLWEAWEKGGVDHDKLQLEYSDILAQNFTHQQRASTPDLQSYMYFQGLEDWVHLQGASVPSDDRIWHFDDMDE
ncbi:hypothetical protein TWF694_004563 [Orbilia ellipsospora]|uniref:Clr5 domain-containing protein n=1 Tax=Orbilia ellipsospora TaxID=2528407 RepID=A0AAV9X1P7_9PEZI